MIIDQYRFGLKICLGGRQFLQFVDNTPTTSRLLSFWKSSKKPSTSESNNEVDVDGFKKDLNEHFAVLTFDNKAEQDQKILAQYEQIKDMSKMKPWHHSLFHDQITPPDHFEWQKERWALKERYAKYGEMSGVNPGVMWMTGQELSERKIEENEWNPQLAETIRIYKENKEAEEKRRAEVIKRVDENLKTYPELMKTFLEKKMSKNVEVEQAKEERAKKLKEIRDSFGYDIEESDPRFKVKLMMLQQEEKTQSRMARKKEKQAKMLEKLQALTASLSNQMPSSTAEEVTPPSDNDTGDKIAHKQ